MTDRLGAARGEILASVQQQISASEGRVLGTVDQRLAQTSGQLTANFQAQMDARFVAEVGPLRGRVDQIDGRTTQNADAIGRLNDGQTANAARIETVSRDSDQARRTLQTTLLGEIDRRLDAAVHDVRSAARGYRRPHA